MSRLPAPVVLSVVSSPVPVVESSAPVPAVVCSPAPVMESSAPAPSVFFSPGSVAEYFSPAPAVSHASAPVVEYFSPAPVVAVESTVPHVEQDTEKEEEEEEYDQPVVYCSGTCEFLKKLYNRWQSRGVGTLRLLRCSEGAKFFQFWQNERLLADDVIQRIGEPGHVLRPARGDPDYAGGPNDYRHAVRFASPELARRFHEEWMG